MKSLLGKYSNSAMTLVMLGIFLVMVAVATRYPAEARFMPFVVGIPPILLCLLQLFLDARERRRAASETRVSELEEARDKVSRMVGHQVELAVPALPGAADTLPPADRVQRELILWGYFLGLIAGILLFGFWVAIPLFLVSFLRFQAEASTRTALVLGLGASVALFLVFERGLKVQVHRGFVTGFVLDHLDR